MFRRDERTWLRWDRATGGEHRLPISGDRAAFFGRWLLVHREGQSRALDWGNPGTLRECEMGFDRGMQGFAPALVATTPACAAIVRNQQIYVRDGAPEAIDAGEGCCRSW